MPESDKMPDVCKSCPENYYCSLKPDLWKCEAEEEQNASRT
ncbi:hypothetical protein ABEX29_25970 [Brevibacillus porteri]|nr:MULTISPECIES: hypothetical protein [unclassified Brevibacillus]